MKRFILAAGAIIVVIATVLVITVRHFYFQTPATVILITGTSSAGKSSIMSELSKSLRDTYRIVKFDDFNSQPIKEKIAIDWGWDQKSPLKEFMRDYRARHKAASFISQFSPADSNKEVHDLVYKGFFEYIKSRAFEGEDIIVDTVFEHVQQIDCFDSIMGKIHMLKVLVYCPLDVIAERVYKRNLSGKVEEQRNPLQALLQFPTFYKVQEGQEETVLDVISSEKLRNAAREIIDQSLRELRQEQIAELEAFYSTFVQQFKLDKLPKITLVARRSYDIITNSSTHTPKEIAQRIAAYLQA